MRFEFGHTVLDNQLISFQFATFSQYMVDVRKAGYLTYYLQQLSVSAHTDSRLDLLTNETLANSIKTYAHTMGRAVFLFLELTVISGNLCPSQLLNL